MKIYMSLIVFVLTLFLYPQVVKAPVLIKEHSLSLKEPQIKEFPKKKEVLEPMESDKFVEQILNLKLSKFETASRQTYFDIVEVQLLGEYNANEHLSLTKVSEAELPIEVDGMIEDGIHIESKKAIGKMSITAIFKEEVFELMKSNEIAIVQISPEGMPIITGVSNKLNKNEITHSFDYYDYDMGYIVFVDVAKHKEMGGSFFE